MSNEKDTDISEKTPISTNLRTVCLAVAGVAVAVWYGSNWMGGVTNKLDTHSAAIQSINSQLGELKAGQEKKIEKLFRTMEGRREHERSAPAAAPKTFTDIRESNEPH